MAIKLIKCLESQHLTSVFTEKFSEADSYVLYRPSSIRPYQRVVFRSYDA